MKEEYYESEEESIYSEEYREQLIDDGEIDIFEDGFMKGYEEAA